MLSFDSLALEDSEQTPFFSLSLFQFASANLKLPVLPSLTTPALGNHNVCESVSVLWICCLWVFFGIVFPTPPVLFVGASTHGTD